MFPSHNLIDYHILWKDPLCLLTLQVPTPKNGQIHSHNSLLKCVWPFCGVGA